MKSPNDAGSKIIMKKRFHFLTSKLVRISHPPLNTPILDNTGNLFYAYGDGLVCLNILINKTVFMRDVIRRPYSLYRKHNHMCLLRR